MRQITKIELDAHTTAIQIMQNGEEIAYEAFPSKPALKYNGIESVNNRLTALEQPGLTASEQAKIQAWMDAIVE
jgi:hypothetical protein